MRLDRVWVGAAAAMAIALAGAAAMWHLMHRAPVAIAVDYPLEGAVFPPEFPPPALEWRDPSADARIWSIDVGFGEDAAPALHAISRGERLQVGEIDPRAIGSTNTPPELTPEQAAAHTWRPDPATWDAIKKRSVEEPATVVIAGYADEGLGRPVSRGRLSLRTSADPVGAPIFHRDVPLMPSAGEKGVIKPLDQKLVPLIAWRIRNVADPQSRVVMQGLHSCTNCHSVSRDGKTMGMDVDGPRNNKGLYALFPIRQRATMRNEDVIEWSTFRGKLGGKLRTAFMSQVSPDGRFVVTTINDPGKGQTDYQRHDAPQDLWSSKSRTPYTQMFLTHIDEHGIDTPPILVENATAANRAVNIPEFINIPPDGLLEIDAPAAEYFRLIDVASNAMNEGEHATAIPLLEQALVQNPGDPFVHNSYGSALAVTGRLREAIEQFKKATELSPDYPDAHNNLAAALLQSGRPAEAIAEFRRALAQKPDLMQAHAGLGGLLAQRGRLDEAIPHLSKAVELDPTSAAARANLCLALSLAGQPAEAIPHAREAVALSNGANPLILDLLGRLYAQANQLADAIEAARRAVDVARAASDGANARSMGERLSAYEAAAAVGSGHP